MKLAKRRTHRVFVRILLQLIDRLEFPQGSVEQALWKGTRHSILRRPTDGIGPF